MLLLETPFFCGKKAFCNCSQLNAAISFQGITIFLTSFSLISLTDCFPRKWVFFFRFRFRFRGIDDEVLSLLICEFFNLVANKFYIFLFFHSFFSSSILGMPVNRTILCGPLFPWIKILLIFFVRSTLTDLQTIIT